MNYFNEQERHQMIADYDELLQKYMRNETTTEEKDQLLIFALKHLNHTLQRERLYRQIITRMTKGQDVTIVIEER